MHAELDILYIDVRHARDEKISKLTTPRTFAPVSKINM